MEKNGKKLRRIKVGIIMTKDIIKISIQEIFNDLYSVAQEEGYLCGLCDGNQPEQKDFIYYHNHMKDIAKKYIPKWKEIIDEEYWKIEEEGEKGLILSNLLIENFREIIYGLI